MGFNSGFKGLRLVNSFIRYTVPVSKNILHYIHLGPGSVVGIANSYGLDICDRPIMVAIRQNEQ